MKNITKLLTKIEELNRQGFTDSQIAREVNLSSSNVNRHRNRLGLATNWLKIDYKNDYDKMRGYMVRNVKFSAKRRNIECSLTYTDFDLPEYCPILNVKLTYRLESNGNKPYHATIDRIDNSKGYIKGNVIVISRLANAMKNEANFEQLALFSKNMQLLTNYYKDQGALGSITDVFPETILRNVSLDS